MCIKAVIVSLFCACAVSVCGSETGRVGVLVAMSCDSQLDDDRRSVINATVDEALSHWTTGDVQSSVGWNVSIEVDVVDACLTQHIISALNTRSYLAVAGPGLYRLCGIAAHLQRSRQVRTCSRLDQTAVLNQAHCYVNSLSTRQT